MLEKLISSLQQIPAMEEVCNRLAAGEEEPLQCGGFWGASRALLLAALQKRLNRPLLITAGTSHEAEDIYGDLLYFLGGRDADPVALPVGYFPHTEVLPYEEISPFGDIVHQRIQTLHRLLNGELNIVVTPVRALLTRLIPADSFVDASLMIRTGDLHEPDELIDYLVNLGYERVARTERAGEFSRKGGIVDIFPANLQDPCRIEFFDIEVESIRRYNAATQVSIEQVDELFVLPQREIMLHSEHTGRALKAIKSIFPATPERGALAEKIENGVVFNGIENYLPLFFDGTSRLQDFFPEEPLLVAADAESFYKNRDTFLRDITELYEGYFSGMTLKLSPEKLFEVKPDFPRLTLATLAPADGRTVAFPIRNPRQFNGNIKELVAALEERRRNGGFTAVFVPYKGQLNRVKGLLRELEPVSGVNNGGAGLVAVDEAPLSGGFELPEQKCAFILEREIFNRRRTLRRKFRTVNSVPVDSFLDLKPGDYVVHLQHGIGLFHGLERKTTFGNEKDYLKIEYRDNEMLYVPLEMINLVQRYLSPETRPPRLDTLGGRSWNKAKAKVQQNVEELAKELVEIYSARMQQRGHRYSADTRWQLEFESSFPYEETPDQQQAIEDVRHDMESERPMDRLICGDVGFGKTEVAVRAAFKAVMDGRQVAVLVPTTILAEQHYQTFRERFDLYPVRVDFLNRFRSAAESRRVLEKLAAGGLDVVIGTHRLLSKDVKFHNLGLVVIDEEQRFGVRHKERLKKLRKLVDVLTLTATPIPRTLHMSLIKVRDMSVIRTPPRSRQPVETYVLEFNENMVRRAVMKELERGGQVYYLHNRVRTIEQVKLFLERLFPDAVTEAAHGQMPEHQLEQVMHDFIESRIDILVCTSIIESGLDIPNANTLIVDRSDLFGLSQLYQIRGRVGRSSEQGYAYLFYPPDKPLTELAQKRLQVLNDFTELGSGFNLAMRDMEIRGVGSMFGSEQSGDIMTVGFDTYCRLLEDAVKEFEIEQEPEPVETVVDLNYEGFLPDEYVNDERQKIEIYKRIASCFSEDEVATLREEVRDRFGPIPEGVSALFTLAELKAEGQRLGVRSIVGHGTQFRLEFDENHRVDPARLVNLVQQRADLSLNPGKELLLIVDNPGGQLGAQVAFLKNILQKLV